MQENNDDIANIAKSHMDYPKRISSYRQKSFGIFYYDTKNPGLHMLNHAVITDYHQNLTEKIQAVTKFYLEKEIMPVIYTPFTEDSYETMAGGLLDCGYQIGSDRDGSFFYYPRNADKRMQFPSDQRVDIRCVNKPSRKLLQLFEKDEQSDYNKVTILKQLERTDFALWVLFRQEQPISFCSTNVMDEHGCVAMDHVYTAPCFRNKGYATRLVKFVADRHTATDDRLLFLYAHRNQAIRIYQRIGFVRAVDRRLQYWNAWKPLDT